MRRSGWLWIVVLAVAMVGCDTLDRDIRGRDYGTVIPAGRIRIDLRGTPQYPDAGYYPDEHSAEYIPAPRTITELEIDVSHAQGDSSRAGVEIGEYRLTEGSLGVRFGKLLRDRVQIVGIAGIGVQRLDLKDRSRAPGIDDNTTELGGRVGMEIRIKFTDWLWLHTRASAFVRPVDQYSTQTEAGLVFGDPDVAAFTLGFRDWRYKDESSSMLMVDEVDLRVSGPFLGFEVRF